MVRPVSGGGLHPQSALDVKAAMSDHSKRDDGDKAKVDPPVDPAASAPASDAELSAKLRRIDARLLEIRSERAQDSPPQGRLAADGTAMARGLRLVSEFVAGIVAGGLLGWIIDRLAGTQPIVLMIGLLFGFAAGLRNLYRATQAQSGPPG